MGCVVMGSVWPLRRTGRGRAWRSAPLLLTAAWASLLAAPAVAAAAPEVEYRVASDVSATGALIEVPINPEGSETSYEIRLECQSASGKQNCEALTVGAQRRQGTLSPAFTAQTVTDAVTGLEPAICTHTA